MQKAAGVPKAWPVSPAPHLSMCLEIRVRAGIGKYIGTRLKFYMLHAKESASSPVEVVRADLGFEYIAGKSDGRELHNARPRADACIRSFAATIRFILTELK